VSKKAWIIFASVCVALLGGLIFVSTKDKIDVSAVDVNAIQTGSAQSGGIADQVLGKADSKVVFIEYGDFQCPGCGGAHPTVKKVTEKYQGQVAFVFRNFPLAAKHPNARAAAATAEAAGLQGKYWEMHNKLYETQSSWQNLSPTERTDFFVGYATDLNLNVETFKTDLASAKVSQKINFDQAVGKKAKVDATPTFFLGGEKPTSIYSENGGIDEAKLDAAFAEALKKHGIELPGTTVE
jgi:protein-disulfide isomerase